jgi:apolipoprotein D and lipocalin family protein
MKRGAWGAAIATAGVAAVGGLLALLCIRRRVARYPAGAPQTAPVVDLARYAGLWYEIARYPTPYQADDCVAATAFYTLRSRTELDVVNTCRHGSADGPAESVGGTARVVDRRTNARLKVTLGRGVGDYWIVDLGEAYDYAVVSDPHRHTLWILSRTPEMPTDRYTDILESLRIHGFDTRKLIRRTR